MFQHEPGSETSTNGRLLMLRHTNRLLSRAAPAIAARLAARLFVTPMRTKEPIRELAWAVGADRETIPSPHGPIPVWVWGEGPETVLLTHGWAGRGLQLGALVEPLVARGYRVITYDAPGHGSARGSTSSLLLFATSLGLVSRRFAPIHGLIAHSLGGTAAIYALANLELSVDRFVAVAPSTRLLAMSQRFGEMTGFHPRVIERMRGLFEESMGFDWEASEPLHLAPEMSTSLMVIHDAQDRFVPHQEGADLAAAWPEARLMTTMGLGHHRILRNPAVVASAVGFIAARSIALPARTSAIESYAVERRAS